jgi:DNA-binding transcriptional MerR regulator
MPKALLLLLREKRYSISEVIKILGVCRKTLYLWEADGRIPKAKRDPMSRYRYWTEKDIEDLKRITQRG